MPGGAGTPSGRASRQTPRYHVVGDRVMSSDLTDGLEAATLQGETVTITLDPVMAHDGAEINAPF